MIGLELGGGEPHREEMAGVHGVQAHITGAGVGCGEQGRMTGAAGKTWAGVASMGCRREHRGESVFGG